MDQLFGVPVSDIVRVLAVAFALVLASLVFILVRDRVLVRMALRNVLRRPMRGILIVVGLMLATAIISSAFTTGDSMTYSIKRNATDSLRVLDEVVRVDDDSPVWEGRPLPNHFSEDVYRQAGPQLEAASDLIDGVTPVLAEPTSVINLRSRQFEVEALLTGLDPVSASRFDTLRDGAGNAIDLASLAPDEVYLDQDGAAEIGAQPGDVLGVALGQGDLTELRVKAVVDGWLYKQSDAKIVLMAPLSRVQELLGREGLISTILVSNVGDAFQGERLTAQVIERFGELPALREAGLELFGLKQEVVDAANAAGSLFVTFFTTFGLFSIGVGLLLIFLIFTMLAAERKSEMGISRAVGMQRSHLVRAFMAEGAIYSLGSAVVGSLLGVGLGFLLVIGASGIFNTGAATDAFDLTPRIAVTSLLVSFFLGSIITYVTVVFASWRISKLNIVRAIRDIPEPRGARAGRATLIWGLLITALGVVILISGYNSAQLTVFGLGVSLIPVGLSMLLRWKGMAQRWALTGVGVVLLVWWLLPTSIVNRIREDWNQDFTVFFVSGALVVTGAVLLLVNNSPLVLGAISKSIGKSRRLAPIVKSATAYPMRFAFRTGLSIAMFAVVIFSVTVMSALLEGFDKLWEDQERFGGGYDVMAISRNELNPVSNMAARVEADPGLAFVARSDGRPQVGAFHTSWQANARLASEDASADKSAIVTGVDDDFIASNNFQMALATAEYTSDDGVDHLAIWRALRDNPGLAVVNALLVPERNDFVFEEASDAFDLSGVEDLYIENDVMEPIDVTIRHLESGATFPLTIIGALDEFASNGPLPFSVFTSLSTFEASIPQEVQATQFFFKVAPGTDDASGKIEAAFFEHGLETTDLGETIEEAQVAQRSFFNLVLAYMTLGLVVGIVALGVISARAVVERRHEIGVMRAIGYSRPMVQLTFLAESSFIALMGIVVGLALGLLTSINVATDIQRNEPDFQLTIPWARMVLIGVAAYVFALFTTYLPSRQASTISPSQALRYD